MNNMIYNVFFNQKYLPLIFSLTLGFYVRNFKKYPLSFFCCFLVIFNLLFYCIWDKDCQYYICFLCFCLFLQVSLCFNERLVFIHILKASFGIGILNSYSYHFIIHILIHGVCILLKIRRVNLIYFCKMLFDILHPYFCLLRSTFSPFLVHAGVFPSSHT